LIDQSNAHQPITIVVIHFPRTRMRFGECPRVFLHADARYAPSASVLTHFVPCMIEVEALVIDDGLASHDPQVVASTPGAALALGWRELGNWNAQ
jgi:hypothetical protein